MIPACTRSALVLSALALGLQGCALTQSEPAGFNVRPAPTVSSQVSARDALYASAASAINRGDYGYALDLLQAAYARGQDPRILNAFGVVYDKLGRFDLSQRYYAAASALDPTSQIVAQNLAYSQILQGKNTPVALAAAAPQPAAAPLPAPEAPPPAVVAPVATAVLAQPPQVDRAELSKAAASGALRPAPTLETPPEATAPSGRPAAAVLADATPWDAPVILNPAPAAAPPRAFAPTTAAAPATKGPLKVQSRRIAPPAASVRTAATNPPAHRDPARVAANTLAPRSPAARAAAIAHPAAATTAQPVARIAAAPRAAPASRGWTLAAAHEQVARMLSRGLRFFEDLERCRNGCSKVTLPLNAKPTLRVTDKAAGGPPYLS